MKLILCHSILKKELKPLFSYFSRGDLKKAARKVKGGLGAKLKSSGVPNTRLVKVYLTGKKGAGRLVILVFVKKDYYVPVILRLKKDKIVGTNIGKSNKAFQKLLNENLALVLSDLEEGNYEKVDL